VKDFYAILGLDSDASAESIKLAYRRLAREIHPDRMGHLSHAARAEASAGMAELNEAYEVLSNPRKRREYDEQFRTFQAGEPVEAPAAPSEVAPEVVPVAPARPRARRGAEVISTVVHEFSNHLRSDLLTGRQTFSWRERKLEGFDWALEAGFWSTRYCVALRAFATANSAATQKFTNYANLAIERRRRLLKKNYFLFLLPFQRITEPEHVSALCRRFTGRSGRPPLGGSRSLIVLLDVSHGRSLPCGPRVQDKRFEQLLQRLGFSRA